MFKYYWDWSIVWEYRTVLAKGALVTLELTFISIIIGSILGFLLGILLSTKDEHWVEIRYIVTIFIDIVRALPILILILLFYFWLPYMLKIRSPFWLAALALSINLAAFIADVLRGAIEGVPQSLIEAGYALGMTSKKVMRRILIPEATRNILPTLALLYIDILKLSSLASVIAVSELVHVSSEISTKTFRFLEIFAALAVIYILIVLPFSYFVRRLEKTRWFLRRA